MNRYRMDQYPTERLMTIEEAQQLSTLEGAYDSRSRDARRRKPVLWAWQTVEGAMAQTVTDEQVDALLRARRER